MANHWSVLFSYVRCIPFISRLGGMDTKGPMRMSLTGGFNDGSMFSGQHGQSRFFNPVCKRTPWRFVA